MKRAVICLLALAGCGDTGFAVSVDVVAGCAKGASSLVVDVKAHPSERNTRVTIAAPVFVDGHRKLAILPPSDATGLTITVRADGDVETLEVSVAGHQIVDQTITLSKCVASDMGADLAINDFAGRDLVGSDLVVLPDLEMVDLIPPAVLSSISITPVNAKVPIGNSVQLTATGTYSDNTTKDVTATAMWTSNDAMTAAVDNALQKGRVTAGMNPGAALITATVGNVAGFEAVGVVAATLSSIVVTPANPSVADGSTVQFVATGIFSDNSNQDISSTVIWSSTDMTVATVSNMQGQKGLASTQKAGSATVKAMQAGVTGASDLTVTAATLTAIVVTPTNPSIANGTTQQFQATGTYSDNSTQDLTKLVAWSSSAIKVATVDANGVASGINMGQSTITASLMGKMGSTALNVTSATLKSIAVSPGSSKIAVTTSQQLQAIGTYSDNSKQDLTSSVTWASSNANVAPVSNAGGSQGLATGTGMGMANITATLGMIVGAAMITVTNATLMTLTITPANATIQSKTTQQYTATGLFTDNSMQDLTAQVTWSSTNAFVATISNVPGSDGLLQANNAGMSTVWAQRSGVFGTTNLKVSGALLVSITVTPANLTLAKGSVQQYTATGNYNDNSMQDLTNLCFWWSSDASVATVSNNGNKGFATVVQNFGTTSINAWANNIQGMTSLTGK